MLLDIFDEIKYFIERGRKGYSSRDLWSFSDFLCEIIPDAVRKLKKKSFGCSSELYDKSRINDECHKWKKILEEIAQGFEAGKSILDLKYFKHEKKGEYYTHEIDEEKSKLLAQKYERGMELFKRYFFSLWD